MATLPIPAGKEEVDWDDQAIEIKNDVEVTIKGQVTTQNTQTGNTSSIILYVDGVEVKRLGGDKAQHTIIHKLSENGKHHVRIVCSNTNADAETCILKITKSDGPIVFG